MKQLGYILFYQYLLVTSVCGQNIFSQIKENYCEMDFIEYINKVILKDCEDQDSEEKINWCYKWNKDRIADKKRFLI